MRLRNSALGGEAASAQMDAMFSVAFAEDKAILEAMQMAACFGEPGSHKPAAVVRRTKM